MSHIKSKKCSMKNIKTCIVANKKGGNKDYGEITCKKSILLRLKNIYKKQEG